jgi:hypothetical protein
LIWVDLFRRYEKKVRDYNFGSLIRTDAKGEYGERNTIFGGQIFAVLFSTLEYGC